jgi:hypothetical protein
VEGFPHSRHAILHVRLSQGRDFKQSDRLLGTALVCSFRLLSEDHSVLSESFKSHPKKPNGSFLTSWDEGFSLPLVIPFKFGEAKHTYDNISIPNSNRNCNPNLGTILHVRVFEFHLLKDLFVCEIFYPLSGLISGLELKEKRGEKVILLSEQRDMNNGKEDLVDDLISHLMPRDNATKNTMIPSMKSEKVISGALISLADHDDDADTDDKFDENFQRREEMDESFCYAEKSLEYDVEASITQIEPFVKDVLLIDKEKEKREMNKEGEEERLERKQEEKEGEKAVEKKFFSWSHASAVIKSESSIKTPEKVSKIPNPTPTTKTLLRDSLRPDGFMAELNWYVCYGRKTEGDSEIVKGELCLGFELE